MKYNIIVAMCKNNRGIGINGTLPWDIKEDLHYFSKMTKGNGKNAIVMGSNTYKSLNKYGLPGRDNLILSSKLNINLTLKNTKDVDTNYVVRSFPTIDEILQSCSANNYDSVWIIGGESIYKQFLEKNIIDKCYMTLIHKLFECDTLFPLLNASEWKIKKKDKLIDDTDKYDFKIEIIIYKKY